MSEVQSEFQQSPSNNLLDVRHDELIAHLKDQGKQIDWLLQFLVKFVVTTPVEIGITLSIGGNLVTGQLISHDAYFEQLADDMAAPLGKIEKSAEESMKNIILSFSPRESADDTTAFHFIHLKDCKTYSSDQSAICAEGVLWRGKIASVDGFTIGLLTRN
jgi:hypothetical protein